MSEPLQITEPAVEAAVDAALAAIAAAGDSAALKAVGGGLGVATAPGSAVIHLTYKADDPERAARVLNTIIEQYLIYRREVFQDKTPAIASQRIARITIVPVALSEAGSLPPRFGRARE